MDRFPIFQVDAFAERPFTGNPAAVVLLPAFLDDARLQSIAAENNLSETAFLVGREGDYQLRWFTPVVEVDLCGHATLASAHVVFHHLRYTDETVRFQTRSGELRVSQAEGGLLAMDFPARPGEPIPVPEGLAEALGATPELSLSGAQQVNVFAHADQVLAMKPDMAALKRLGLSNDRIGVVATAPYEGPEDWDFVSRMFAPAKGIDEDPVTGSAHCALTPYWAKRLGKTNLIARQASARGGTVWCRDAGERVILRGRCADYLQGEISVNSGASS